MKKIALLVLCILLNINLFSQILKPVKWSYGAKKINKKEAMVFIKATIDDGWHIYSTRQVDGGPIKTSFTFLPGREYSLIDKVAEPKPITKYENNFNMDVHYFEKSVIFQQKVRLNTKRVIVKGKLTFMVCNNEKCLPPEDIVFNIGLE